jgi:chaperonin GroEL
VLRVSLENAVSTAAMILTTEAVVVDWPEEKGCCSHGGSADAGAGMWGMGGMGMY